jgi:ParB family chromosome partitioning protein
MSAGKAPPRLGKGLSALLGDRPAATPAQQAEIQALPLDVLEPSAFQPRGPLDAAALADLTASIKARGVLQPILVRPHPKAAGRYQIIAGERRWRASGQAGLATVPVVVRALSDLDAMAAALVENLQRADLNPIEEARGYRRLLDEFGLTQDALATAVGKSRTHLTNTLRLLALPELVQTQLANGLLTAGHGKALVAAPDAAAIAQKVVMEGLSVRATEALAGRARPSPATGKPTAAPTYRVDPEVKALADDLTLRLGLRVTIEGSGGRGRIVMEFKSLEQFDGLLALLTGGER